MEEDGISQTELAKNMGISAKHINQMVSGKSGAIAMYEYAAFALGRTWGLSLTSK